MARTSNNDSPWSCKGTPQTATNLQAAHETLRILVCLVTIGVPYFLLELGIPIASYCSISEKVHNQSTLTISLSLTLYIKIWYTHTLHIYIHIHTSTWIWRSVVSPVIAAIFFWELQSDGAGISKWTFPGSYQHTQQFRISSCATCGCELKIEIFGLF